MDPESRRSPDHSRSFNKILVIDDDVSTATTIARLLPKSAGEVIACADMALAEAAVDLTDFDVILVAPSTTGLDGGEGLAVLDFLRERNPTALLAVMVSTMDGDLRAASERNGAHAVLTKPLVCDELAALSRAVGIPITAEARR